MEKSQLICFITLAIFLAATLFFLCGFGGPNWVEKKHVGNAGLWKVCSDVADECDDIKLKDTEDWFKATAALMILAFLGVIASGVTFLWLPITAICHCVTGGLILFAVIVFGAEYEGSWDFGWSFGLAAFSAILFLINGGLMAFLALSSSCVMTRRPIPCIGGSNPA